MDPIHRILTAVKDPTARALPAVAKATQLARALEADLELFHVVDSCSYVDMFGFTQGRVIGGERELEQQYRQQLERIAARARLHAKSVTVAVESDYPAYEAIVRRAIATGADLIVAERHERRSIAPGLLRLPDWELLRLSPVPVLLVKTPKPYHHPTVLGAVDPNHAFGKPRDLDDEILQAGTTIAEALKGRLHAVHAYHISAGNRRGLRANVSPHLRMQAQAASMRFDQALRNHNVSEGCRHLEPGLPCDTVWKVARDIRADIVVAGALSRSGARRALIGNTAELLFDCLPCDLLIVKPAGFRCPVQRESRGGRYIAPQPLG